jgi:hypothetical protein
MKEVIKAQNWRGWFALLMFCLVQTVLWAQEEAGGSTGSSTSTTKTSVKITEDTTWYASPWVWVAGAAVFILLLVALTRGGGSSRAVDSRSDRVTVTKEVRRDSDV